MKSRKDNIDEMMEALRAKHFECSAHAFILNPAEKICEALYDAGYRKPERELEHERKEN